MPPAGINKCQVSPSGSLADLVDDAGPLPEPGPLGKKPDIEPDGPTVSSITTTTSSGTNPSDLRRRVYNRRWVVLITVALLNSTNAMLWISYASIANHVDKFYDWNVSLIN